MPTLDQVLAFREEMYDKSRAIIQRKGRDYNRAQQAGDTLFNLKVCERLGIVAKAEHGILVRLSDKLMRLISLIDGDPANVDESFEDTVVDIHNYVDYVALLRRERRQEEAVAKIDIRTHSNIPDDATQGAKP